MPFSHRPRAADPTIERPDNARPSERYAGRAFALAWLLLGLAGCGKDERIAGGAPPSPEDAAVPAASAGADAAPMPSVDPKASVFDPTQPAPVGSTCLSDLDCPAELTCARSVDTSILGGGPAHGYCTSLCSTDAECEALHPDTLCDVGVCLLRCAPGVEDEEKCHGRLDLACSPYVGVAFGACFPSCGHDDECGAGGFCDFATGVCVAARPEGLPIGAACDDGAGANECAGICYGDGDTGTCSGFCRLGTLGCNSELPTLAAGDAACLSAPPAAVVGDEGLCTQLCDCDGDCHRPDALCVPFASEGLSMTLGVAGYCSNEGASSGTACVADDAGDGGRRGKEDAAVGSDARQRDSAGLDDAAADGAAEGGSDVRQDAARR